VGNYKTVLRKPRKDLVTKECSKLFEKAVQEEDWATASLIVYYNIIKVYGVASIMKALDDANSFINRKKLLKERKER
jgi:tryptophan synthase alpha subunit